MKDKKEQRLKSANHMTEEEIQAEYATIRLAKRDVRAFGKLYDKYFEGIFTFIFRRTDNEDLASDLTSQAFLKAMQNLNKYEFRGLPFSAWLYRIASNEVYKYYRSTKTKKVFSLEESKVAELMEHSLEMPTEEYIQTAMELLSRLPTDMVEALELRFFEDKSFKEMAYILDVSESGAKMRTYRAVEKLREYFNQKINQ